MDLKEFGEYIKSIRLNKNLSLRQVDYQSEITFSNLSMIEHGTRKATPFILKELSRIYKIDYIDLLDKAGYIDLAEAEKIKNITKTSTIPIPVYGKISAGIPNWAEECLDGYLPIDPNLMGITNLDDCFFLKVNGESMNKEIRNGAYALIRKQDSVEDGEIAAVLVNGFEATLKKFSRQEDFIILEPMSTDDSFKTQIYDKKTNIKILGKYIGKFEIK